MKGEKWMKGRKTGLRLSLGKIMKCLCSGEQLRVDEMVPSSESLATRDYSASLYSSRTGEVEHKPDNGNIEEAESSLRESGFLNYEEARALLGRLEYQRGNKEAALYVFEGIDIASVIPKIKLSIARRDGGGKKRRSKNVAPPPMSMHAVTLLFEAIFLKAKTLQDLGRLKEAAQSCTVILDTIESALPEGFPVNFDTDSKLEGTLSKAVELLPELWKFSGFPHEAILSYRRALLYPWILDDVTFAKIQKEFAIFLLYGGTDATPPNLRSQTDGSFVPRNNIEEAVLLLLILSRKMLLKRIEWDPSIIEHLSFALSVSGGLRALANQVEELLPGILERKERYYTLALCYYGESEDVVALNLLNKMLNDKEGPDCIPALLLASKICCEKPDCAKDGVKFSRRALESLQGGCEHLKSLASCLLGISLSSQGSLVISESQRITKQAEALEALETANKMERERNPNVLFHLSLENAEQRKLDDALYYAKLLLRLEGGSNIKVWLLLARILSAQKRFIDAETFINAAMDETGKWDRGELLRTKAKLQIAQGQLKNAVETYTDLLAVIQVQSKSFGVGNKLIKVNRDPDRSLEMETWHDLANVYTGLSQWRDAEICLSKSMAISPYSASRWHAIGLLYEAKGLHNDALRAFTNALDIEPTHVPSLVSTAIILRQLGNHSLGVARSYLTDALRLDRTNYSAWYNLGLLYIVEGDVSAVEAAECFESASLLEETAPVEPFK